MATRNTTRAPKAPSIPSTAAAERRSRHPAHSQPLKSVLIEAQSVRPSHDASPDIQRTIAEAIELVETTQRALQPNEQRASEYGTLAQAVAKLWAAHNQVELLPSAAATDAPDFGRRVLADCPESAKSVTYRPEGEWVDDTSARIEAFLASVRFVAGLPLMGERADTIARGRRVIEDMAASVTGTDLPAPDLTPAHCADVLAFLDAVEPVEPATWWRDPKIGASHYVGRHFVLNTVEDSMRAGGEE